MPRPRLLPDTNFWPVFGAKIPIDWAMNLEAHAKETRTTRHSLVRDAVDVRMRELGSVSIVDAAGKLGMNKSQFVRDTLEKAYPEQCSPISEYRGDGARYSTVGRKRTVSVPLTGPQYATLQRAYVHWIEAHPLNGLDTLDKFVVGVAVQWAKTYNEKHNLTEENTPPLAAAEPSAVEG